jgi:hypothetical protein
MPKSHGIERLEIPIREFDDDSHYISSSFALSLEKLD